MTSLHDESRITRQTKKAPKVLDTAPRGLDNQPVSSVEWVARERIVANDYNPNIVAPPELKLLKISIMADGWTQPIVVYPVLGDDTYRVVDGFHRWAISGDPDVFALTEGRVPVVILREVSDEHRMMSTIRHNRARGEHQVMSMADIVTTLVGNGLPREKVAELLQMEDEEVGRFLDRGNMLVRGSAEEFGKGWVPE